MARLQCDDGKDVAVGQEKELMGMDTLNAGKREMFIGTHVL